MTARIVLIAALAFVLTPAVIAYAANKEVDKARSEYLRAQDDDARSLALKALVATDDEEAVEFIVERMSRDLPDTERAAFIAALASFKGDKPLKALIKSATTLDSDTDTRLVHFQCDLFTALVLNTSADRATKAVTKQLDRPKLPWATLAMVEAIRAAEVTKPGSGKRFIAEVRALLEKSNSKVVSNDFVVVNIFACLKQLTPKDTPAERNATVKALVDWQEWSRNTKPRLQDMGDRVLHHLTGETCTLNAETLNFWRWWLANSPNEARPQPSERGTRTPFGSPAVGDHIVFVIDVSESMNREISDSGRDAIKAKCKHLDWGLIKTKLDLARQELIYSINQLNPGDGVEDADRPRFAIVVYSDRVFARTNGWLVASKAGCEAGVEIANKLEIKFTTDIHGGLAKAFEIHEGSSKAENPDTNPACVLTGAHTIVFLTDGFATTNDDKSLLKPANIAASIRRLNRFRKVVINTVGIGNHDSQLMRQLATENDGNPTDWSFKERNEEKDNFGPNVER